MSWCGCWSRDSRKGRVGDEEGCGLVMVLGPCLKVEEYGQIAAVSIYK